MTFLEAALEILRREGRPLHYKELTERALGKKLLTFVGRTPEVTMQTQLTAAVKKAPGNPFVRVKPGVFGLLRYPELTAEEREAIAKAEAKSDSRPSRGGGDGKSAGAEAANHGGEEGRRRRRRRGRGRGTSDRVSGGAGAANAGEAGTAADLADDSEAEEPASSSLTAEARAAALAESGILEAEDEPGAEDDEAGLGQGLGHRSHGESMADDDASGGHPSAYAARAEADAGALSVAHQEGEGIDSLGPAGDAGEDSDAEGPAGADRGRRGGQGEDELGARPGEAGDENEEEGEGDGDGDEGAMSSQAEARPGEEGGPGRRRRRRRRRGRGADSDLFSGEQARGGGGVPTAGGLSAAPEGSFDAAGGTPGHVAAAPSGAIASAGEGASAPAGEDGPTPAPSNPSGPSSEPPGPRRIFTPVDAALEILRGQAPGRGVHVRQIADAAARRRLVHGEPNEAWRVMRTALAAEPRERLRAGLRPRVRSAGAGLFALARRPPDGELERAEQVFGEARRALRERTLAALERRIADLPASAFEALGRVLLQREGFGPATFVKRVDGTIYVEAMRGRGSRPSKCLIALRFGPTSAGVRSIGELRAGIAARGQDEGLLMLAGRLADDAIAKWKQPGPPVEIADGPALAETCIRHGIGVINTMVSVDFVDADFFAEIAEG